MSEGDKGVLQEGVEVIIERLRAYVLNHAKNPVHISHRNGLFFATFHRLGCACYLSMTSCKFWECAR